MRIYERMLCERTFPTRNSPHNLRHRSLTPTVHYYTDDGDVGDGMSLCPDTRRCASLRESYDKSRWPVHGRTRVNGWFNGVFTKTGVVYVVCTLPVRPDEVIYKLVWKCLIYDLWLMSIILILLLCRTG